MLLWEMYMVSPWCAGLYKAVSLHFVRCRQQYHWQPCTPDTHILLSPACPISKGDLGVLQGQRYWRSLKEEEIIRNVGKLRQKPEFPEGTPEEFKVRRGSCGFCCDELLLVLVSSDVQAAALLSTPLIPCAAATGYLVLEREP